MRILLGLPADRNVALPTGLEALNVAVEVARRSKTGSSSAQLPIRAIDWWAMVEPKAPGLRKRASQCLEGARVSVTCLHEAG